jgi:hypothetical protein
MTVQTDHDQEVDVSGKIDHMADLVRQAARKGLKDGDLTPDMLQAVNENGGLFQEQAMPALIKIMRQIGMIGKMVDSALLEPMTMVSAPAVANFNAKTRFKDGKTIEGVKFWSTGSNFDAHFMGKTEKDVPAVQLRAHKLRKGAKDPEIIEALGGEAIVETNLATMWEMMKKQGQGEEGDLLVNGYANIFYIRDTKGDIWAVCCDWGAGCGWSVGACAISDPFDWSAGDRVFSR